MSGGNKGVIGLIDEVAFSDASGSPNSRRRLEGSIGLNNWSHDLFARKIAYFASVNNIGGCGNIAHSQGGLASLHLYTYYWSCLDYPGVAIPLAV